MTHYVTLHAGRAARRGCQRQSAYRTAQRACTAPAAVIAEVLHRVATLLTPPPEQER